VPALVVEEHVVRGFLDRGGPPSRPSYAFQAVRSAAA
jgi:hypothetical protein